MLSRTLALLVLLTLGAPSALAQTGAAPAAEALFAEGRRLMAKGAYGEACAKFAESQRLDPAAGTLLNLATCQQYAGKTASAWATFKEASAAAERAHRVEWAKKARAMIAALEPQLSRLTITVPAAARIPGLVVTRAGVEVGSAEWGVAIPVDGGTYVVEASAPHRRSWRVTVEIPPSRGAAAVEIPVLEEEVTEKPPPAPSPPPSPPPAPAAAAPRAPAPAEAPPPTPTPSTTPSRTLPIVTIALGGAAIAVGSGFGLAASKSFSDARPFCNAERTRCTPEGVDEIDAAHRWATISTVAFVAGGAALATGIVLFLTAPAASGGVALEVRPRAGGATSSLSAKW